MNDLLILLPIVIVVYVIIAARALNNDMADFKRRIEDDRKRFLQ